MPGQLLRRYPLFAMVWIDWHKDMGCGNDCSGLLFPDHRRRINTIAQLLAGFVASVPSFFRAEVSISAKGKLLFFAGKSVFETPKSAATGGERRGTGRYSQKSL